MRVVFVLVLCAAFQLAAGTPADAQDLWAGTRAGMSVAEVERRFPDAMPQPPPPAAGQLLLTIPSRQIAAEPFRVAFVFHHRKLEKVGLVYLGNKSFAQLLPVYEAVLAMLQADYGPATTHRSERGEITNNEEHTWRDEARTVQMSMTSYLDRDAIFAIRYQAK